MESDYRLLPSVDKLLSDERVKELSDTFPHEVIVDVIRERLESERESISRGESRASEKKVVDDIVSSVEALGQSSLRPVINATGVILHTNLGRAPLSKDTIRAMEIAAKNFNNLEFDLDTGVRGSRHVHIERLLCQVTGAEAGIVVNNNASAVLLALTVLAKKKEVIVSRGQAVEIGGGFRIPDVMRQSGAKLVEVGTTNCTYARDYEQAITERTAALLRVHPSNFRVEGYTNDVTLDELMELSIKYGIPIIDDLGSGCLLDITEYGLAEEPMVQGSVRLGTGLTCFSGDKLIGGPQAGIIVGKKDLVDKLRKHALVRAIRIDKVRLAGLTATLIHYLKGEATAEIPIWRMISMPLDEVARRCQIWAKPFEGIATVIDGESMVGGGSLPGSTLPTKLVAISGEKSRKGPSFAQTTAKLLRQQETPVIGRISDDDLLLDPRTVFPEEDDDVVRALTATLDGIR